MKKINHVVFLSALAIALLPSNSVWAQTAPLKLKEGEDVKLKFAQDISSKTATEGETVNFVVTEDVKVGGVVVIKAGTKAIGTVTNVKRAGMTGKGGELDIRAEYLSVANNKVILRGVKNKDGDNKTGQSVGLLALFGPIGLIKHGDEITIAEGTPIAAYVADDVMLPPANHVSRKSAEPVTSRPH